MAGMELASRNVLGSSGWIGPATVRISSDGLVSEVTPGVNGDARPMYGPLVPGMPNVHSHAFQRQMAGLTEGPAGQADTFWTWRDAMYRVAQALSPETLGAIAAWLQSEMLEAGFTSCGEFHYVHHRSDGRPYDDPAEMAAALLAAAEASGIALTLLPVLYCRGGFGRTDVLPEQRRFRCSPEQFLRLLEACRSLLAGHPLHRLGVAPHSLRAVSPADLRAVLASADAEGLPVHIHVAEQMSEVEECRAHLGAAPVAWLVDNQPVDARWCLVHATHVQPAELKAAAATGAVAGVCPTTEAELGDGCFAAEEWLEAGGRLGIGSDSNLRVSVAEELRALEFQCRLRLMRRNVLTRPGRSCGRSLYDWASAGGAAALQQPVGRIEPGLRADLVELDERHPLLAARSGDAILDTWLFAGGKSMVRSVWVGGRKWVVDGQHVARDAILQRFRAAMRVLSE